MRAEGNITRRWDELADELLGGLCRQEAVHKLGEGSSALLARRCTCTTVLLIPQEASKG